jgi:hypothetical protein
MEPDEFRKLHALTCKAGRDTKAGRRETTVGYSEVAFILHVLTVCIRDVFGYTD